MKPPEMDSEKETARISLLSFLKNSREGEMKLSLNEIADIIGASFDHDEREFLIEKLKHYGHLKCTSVDCVL